MIWSQPWLNYPLGKWATALGPQVLQVYGLYYLRVSLDVN